MPARLGEAPRAVLSGCYGSPEAVPSAIGALGANNITGTVRHQSRGQPATGDEVILIQADGGMQEEAHAKTDARGAFTLPVRYPDKLYLVCVLHQKANYDQRASAGDSLSFQVFDTAPQVRGVTGSTEILRTGTKGNQLHVSDLYEIKTNPARP